LALSGHSFSALRQGRGARAELHVEAGPRPVLGYLGEPRLRLADAAQNVPARPDRLERAGSGARRPGQHDERARSKENGLEAAGLQELFHRVG
jgi:hypothetical protein